MRLARRVYRTGRLGGVFGLNRRPRYSNGLSAALQPEGRGDQFSTPGDAFESFDSYLMQVDSRGVREGLTLRDRLDSTETAAVHGCTERFEDDARRQNRRRIRWIVRRGDLHEVEPNQVHVPELAGQRQHLTG